MRHGARPMPRWSFTKGPRAPVRTRAGRRGSRSASTWRRFSSAARHAGSTSTRRRSARSGRCSTSSCRLSGPDETVASAPAAPFLERRFELVPLDGGAQGADRPYRLTGQERRGLGLWGAMTQFVGRHEELEVLRSRVAAAGSGHGPARGGRRGAWGGQVAPLLGVHPLASTSPAGSCWNRAPSPTARPRPTSP